MIRHKLSQVFLRNRSVADRIVRELATRCSNNKVLEIGPGHGILTRRLLDAGFEVIAVEIDCRLAGRLEKYPGALTVVHDSILNQNPGVLAGAPSFVIGSLPYHLSGAILRWSADFSDLIAVAVYVLQNEVVGRMAAPPGDRRRGLLSVIMQSVFDVTPLFRISPGSFHPHPQVWSRAVRLTGRQPAQPISAVKSLWKVATVLFQQRRKMIGGRLTTVYGKRIADHVRARGVDLTRRPETLTLAELELITQVIQDVNS